MVTQFNPITADVESSQAVQLLMAAELKSSLNQSD